MAAAGLVQLHFKLAAAVGLDALAAGNVVAIPGAANRFATRVSRLIPNRLLLPLLAKNHPGLKEQ
ncbi:MAG: hypothetical protein WCI12_05115 [Actinomycetes bacterium]